MLVPKTGPLNTVIKSNEYRLVVTTFILPALDKDGARLWDWPPSTNDEININIHRWKRSMKEIKKERALSSAQVYKRSTKEATIKPQRKPSIQLKPYPLIPRFIPLNYNNCIQLFLWRVASKKLINVKKSWGDMRPSATHWLHLHYMVKFWTDLRLPNVHINLTEVQTLECHLQWVESFSLSFY